MSDQDHLLRSSIASALLLEPITPEQAQALAREVVRLRTTDVLGSKNLCESLDGVCEIVGIPRNPQGRHCYDSLSALRWRLSKMVNGAQNVVNALDD